MNASGTAIQIIPDLTIDDKYSAIIEAAHQRMSSFTANALRDGRVGELFVLKRTPIDATNAVSVLEGDGRLMVGFQFEARPEASESSFQIFVKKSVPGGKQIKFYLTPTVQEIMLQLISLEDRRTVAVFSMLNSSLDLGYRILTNLYGSQLRRLVDKTPPLLFDAILGRLERMRGVKSPEESDLWKDNLNSHAAESGNTRSDRPGSHDNILQVMADESTAEEINEYVGSIMSRTERIEGKRQMLEDNPDIPRSEFYEQMIREDFDHLENCYARMHVYLRAFYKNQAKRNSTRNMILRQFFAAQIETISGETALLEDLLSLNKEEYFKNIDRHKEL